LEMISERRRRYPKSRSRLPARPPHARPSYEGFFVPVTPRHVPPRHVPPRHVPRTEIETHAQTEGWQMKGGLPQIQIQNGNRDPRPDRGVANEGGWVTYYL
jgi:hypothetical protein